jgi:hypothetical protein
MEAEKGGRLGKWRLKREEGRGNGGRKERKVGEMEAEKRGRLGKWRLKREEGRGNGG